MDRWSEGRPFGSSERVSKSDPFSSNNRLSISRTFPGTPPNNHTLPFPDVLAQTPKFNYPLIRLRSASPAHSLLNHPKLVFPPNKHPQHPPKTRDTSQRQNKTKGHRHHHHYLPSLISILSPSALSSRHSAGRSSALMTRRILTHARERSWRDENQRNTGSPSTTMETLPFVFGFSFLLTPPLCSPSSFNPTKWQCQEKLLTKKNKKCHVAMSCRQMSLESVGLAPLSRLRLRAHQRSPLAAGYAPLEALEPIAPHSDLRTDNARSPRL